VKESRFARDTYNNGKGTRVKFILHVFFQKLFVVDAPGSLPFRRRVIIGLTLRTFPVSLVARSGYSMAFVFGS